MYVHNYVFCTEISIEIAADSCAYSIFLKFFLMYVYSYMLYIEIAADSRAYSVFCFFFSCCMCILCDLLLKSLLIHVLIEFFDFLKIIYVYNYVFYVEIVVESCA